MKTYREMLVAARDYMTTNLREDPKMLQDVDYFEHHFGWAAEEAVPADLSPSNVIVLLAAMPEILEQQPEAGDNLRENLVERIRHAIIMDLVPEFRPIFDQAQNASVPNP